MYDISLRKWRRSLVVAALLLYSLAPRAADLAGSRDHPLLSRFPDTTIVGYEARDYEAAYIPGKPSTSKGFQEGQWVYGRFTWIVYQAAANRSTLEIYRNYEAALARAGFETTFSCQKEACGDDFIRRTLRMRGRMIAQYESWKPDSGRYLAARLNGEAGEFWVSLLVHEDSKQQALIRLEIVEVSEPRRIDPYLSLTENFPGAKQVGAEDREYDEARVAADGVRDKALGKVLNLEGKVAWRAYEMPLNVAPIGVERSYRSSLEEMGWERIYSCAERDCGSDFIRKVVQLNGNLIGNYESWKQDSGLYALMTREDMGSTSYLALLAYQGNKNTTMVRTLLVTSVPLALDQVTVSAESLAQDMDESGRVSVYGIYFDTDKADIRADSDSTLKAIAQLFKLRPQLFIYVDGHTDDRGPGDYNLDLSRRRATSVVHALTTRFGVDSARLEARGLGETQPVDDNATSEGRAKNRRVELVARTAN